ncbi:hypothetical protein GE09DRAFT_1222466 [Coniochaeta sp. 2T2.1]|nr:hypothetical protein GE09DRAFT_1222466 [Coniochaeta sp. 2T2.1]
MSDLKNDMSGTVAMFAAEEVDVDQLGPKEGLAVVVGELVFDIPADLQQASKGDRVFELPKYATRVLRGDTTRTCLVVSKMSDAKVTLYVLGDKLDRLRTIRPLKTKMDKSIAWYGEWLDSMSDANGKKRLANIKATIARFKDDQRQSRAPPLPALQLEVDEVLVDEAKREKAKALHAATKDPVFLEEGEPRPYGDERPRLGATFGRADIVSVLEAENKHRSAIIAALECKKEKDAKHFPGGIPVATTSKEFTLEFAYKRLMDAVASGDGNEAQDACREFMKVGYARAHTLVDDAVERMRTHTKHDEFLIAQPKATD